MAEAVRYETRGVIGLITLDRPDNRNSMTPELLDAFAAASAHARADASIRALVVTGTGACFSSGADFKSTLQRQDDHREPHEKSFAMYEPFLSLLELRVPVIGALNGHTVGGGFGLALVCVLRIGALDAKYGANFVKLGLAPGMAISYMLPRLIGMARASDLLLTGRLVAGEEAERMGILNRAVPAADVMTVTMELAHTIAANAPFAVQETKLAIRRGLGLEIVEGARAESHVQAASVVMDDAREGVAAFMAKRSPVFTGR